MAVRLADGVAVSALVLAGAVSVAAYDRLPAMVATHFDLAGQPNGWMPRLMAVTFTPALGAALWAGVRFGPYLLPAAKRKNLTAASLALVASMMSVFLAALHILLVWVALTPGASITRPLVVMMSAFWLALGLVLPRIRRNPIIGVRTPWSMASDENWARAQRVASYAMVAGGLLAIGPALAGGTVGAGVAMAVLVGTSLIPAVYSLRWRKSE